MHLELWKILLLAAIQGVTEFLPISSSGHTVILADLISSKGSPGLDIFEVNVVLHLGTLLSILVFYRRAILQMVAGDYRTIVLLVVGTLPAVAIGLCLKVFIDEVLSSTLVSGWMLIATGSLLLWASRWSAGKRTYQQLSWWQAACIGTAQAAAILPGLSRSGTTISAGLGFGLCPQSAGTFSFLLAIPAILGGGLVEALPLLRGGRVTTPSSHLALGALTAFVVGWCSLHWLMRWLNSGHLGRFAWWCIPVGVIVVVWKTVVFF